MFPAYIWHPFGQRHVEFWEWAQVIKRGDSPRPLCAFWPRGSGKSTHAEILAADLGARGKRLYCLYVSGTQDQADKHVATIGAMLESEAVAKYAPEVGKPRITKTGSRTWNRRIMRSANGFTVEAVGLNKAVRGQKIDWARPDLIILDDIDERHDTENTIKKKVEIITTSILPAGSEDCAVVFVQNLIHADSIASSLSKRGEEGADFLYDRIISGPYPAIEGLKLRAWRPGKDKASPFVKMRSTASGQRRLTLSYSTRRIPTTRTHY
jgi:hypothetical protein